MSSMVRPASIPSFPGTLRDSIGAVLLVVAMGVGFLWASDHDEQRCAQLVLLALLVPTMLLRPHHVDHIAWVSPAARACLGAFFVLGLVSALRAFSFRHAIYEWAMMLLLALAAAQLAGEISRLGLTGLQRLLCCVTVLGILYALRMLLVYAAMLASGVLPDLYTLTPGFSNYRFFNHVQTALLPMVVLLYLLTPKATAWRRASFSLAAFWWAFLFLSEARASALGLGAGLMTVFLVRGAKARSFMRAMLFTALAGVMVYLLAFVLIPHLLGMTSYSPATNLMQRTAADPTSRRNLLWQLSCQLIAAHPWLGVGPLHFAHEGAALRWGAHPHNYVLQIAAEWGLPALLCVLGAIGIGMLGLIRSGKHIAPQDESKHRVLAAMLFTGVAILVDGLFSGVIVMPMSQMAIVLYLGCAAGWARSLEPARQPRAGTSLRWLTAGLAVIALCGLGYGVAPTLAAHARHDPLTPAEQAANPDIQWPRLWEAGYF